MEHYVTRQEMAEILRVSTDTLDRFVKAGMPSHTWGTRRRYFLPSEAMPWLEARGTQNAHDLSGSTA
jgi:phage terminase Nu1 subunit (DNA packaging protein)